MNENYNYSDYLAEKLDTNIQYSEYIAENISNTLNYAQYLADNLDKSVDYAVYISEALNPEELQKASKRRLRSKKIKEIFTTEELKAMKDS